MKPIFQTLGGKGTGNCFTACLASIFEIPIESIPHFCRDTPENEDWVQKVQEWLAIYGFGAFEFNPPFHTSTLPIGVYCIISGVGPRDDIQHAVVGRTNPEGFAWCHDPGGEWDGETPMLKTPTSVMLFVPLHPHEFFKQSKIALPKKLGVAVCLTPNSPT